MRRYRAELAAVGLIAVAGLAGPPLVGGAKAPGTIHAKRFEVVGDSGSVRAILDGSGDHPTLRPLTLQGATRR